MSLHSGEIDDIMLPPTTRAIKDLHISPHNNGLAVYGSLGKKLSVLRSGHYFFQDAFHSRDDFLVVLITYLFNFSAWRVTTLSYLMIYR